MKPKDFHGLMEDKHVLGIIYLSGRYQKVLEDKSKLTQTPEVIEDVKYLQMGADELEILFERKIIEIIQKHKTS